MFMCVMGALEAFSLAKSISNFSTISSWFLFPPKRLLCIFMIEFDHNFSELWICALGGGSMKRIHFLKSYHMLFIATTELNVNVDHAVWKRAMLWVSVLSC